MPIPWEPYDGPRCFTANWGFALLLGNDRAASHHRKQAINWDESLHEWRIEDEHEG